MSDTKIEDFVSKLSGDGAGMARLPFITPFDLWEEYVASQKSAGLKEETVSLYEDTKGVSLDVQEVPKEDLLRVLQFLNKEITEVIRVAGIHELVYGGLDVIEEMALALPSLDLESLLKMKPSRGEFVSHRDVSLKLSSVYRCLSEEQRKRDAAIPLLSFIKILHSGLNSWRNAVTAFLMDDIRFKRVGVTERKRAVDQVVCVFDSYLDIFSSMKSHVQDTLKSLESRIDLLLRVDSALRLIVNAQSQSISANRVESYNVTSEEDANSDSLEENSFCGYAPVQESSLEECVDALEKDLEKEICDSMSESSPVDCWGEFEHH